MTGVTPSTYRRWEAAENGTSPNGRQIVAMCKFYGVSPAWLLMGVGPPMLKDLELLEATRRAVDAIERLEAVADRLGK